MALSLSTSFLPTPAAAAARTATRTLLSVVPSQVTHAPTLASVPNRTTF